MPRLMVFATGPREPGAYQGRPVADAFAEAALGWAIKRTA